MKIGEQNGIAAAMNRQRDLDPGGTLLTKDAKGKWRYVVNGVPSVSTGIAALVEAGVPLSSWKATDKLERTLSILATDHDEEPAPASPLDPLWQRDVVFTRTLSSFSGVERDAARAAGFSVILVQLDHTPYVAANRSELAAIGDSLRADGWVVAGWSTYGDKSDPRADGVRHAGIVAELKLAGWVPNGELWAEGDEAWKSAAYVEGWRLAGGSAPLMVSCLSSTVPGWAREFDYDVWLDVDGAAIGPQVYGASDPGYTVANMLDTMRRAGVPDDRLAPAFNVQPDPPGPKGTGPFPDYMTWRGPRAVYTGDDSTTATWEALRR